MQIIEHANKGKYDTMPDFIRERITEVRRARLRAKTDPTLEARKKILRAKIKRIENK